MEENQVRREHTDTQILPENTEPASVFPEDDSFYEDAAVFFKMFGDPTRLRLLAALLSGERCVGELAQTLGLTKSAVSHALAGLRMLDLVRPRRDGKIVYYAPADGHVRLILEMGFAHLREKERAE